MWLKKSKNLGWISAKHIPLINRKELSVESLFSSEFVSENKT
jgi:hypothetical protein